MAGFWRREEEAEPISDVNVVPLADVSLVLLIILLVLSPMTVESRLHVKTAAKSTEAPSPEAPEEPAPKPKELVLLVDLGPAGVMVNDIFFGKRREFLAYMRLELPSRTDRKVFLAPHPDVTHGDVMETIEELKSCGADSVALVQTSDPGSAFQPQAEEAP
ncbi:MAG: biopolymer transporter ExbD [Elusimicrobia bacterium]|nr:biopolymer transporter ExbD [Elusimicrobiota bacterium]